MYTSCFIIENKFTWCQHYLLNTKILSFNLIYILFNNITPCEGKNHLCLSKSNLMEYRLMYMGSDLMV